MRHNPQTYRARIPIGLLAAAIIVVCLLAGALLAIFWREWQLFSLAYPLVADVLRFCLFAAPVSLGVGYAYAGLAIVWRRYGEREHIRADKVIALTKAQRAFPDALHSLSFHDSHKELPALPAPELLPMSNNSAPIPTFAQLLDQGLIGPGRSLILGYSAATGQAIIGSWRDLYSCGVGALQGAGKSWLCAFLLAQSAAAGGRLIICDPHAGSDESLANRIAALASAFMCDVATTDDEILAALKLADDKLRRRMHGTAGQWPIVVAVDEWSSLLRGRLGDELPGLVQNIAEQGRKYHVNALLSAQGWTKDAAGIVRQRLTSHYVMRQKQDEARYQLGLPAARIPDDIRLLPDANGYFLNVKGELIRIVIPQMTAADIARCGELIDRPASAINTQFGFQLPTTPLRPPVAEWKPNGSALEAPRDPASTPTARVKTVSPEAARAYGLFMAGSAPSEIAEVLRGVKASAGGRAYQKALIEVYDLIREGGQK
jgi:hypothetical protein